MDGTLLPGGRERLVQFVVSILGIIIDSDVPPSLKLYNYLYRILMFTCACTKMSDITQSRLIIQYILFLTNHSSDFYKK